MQICIDLPVDENYNIIVIIPEENTIFFTGKTLSPGFRGQIVVMTSVPKCRVTLFDLSFYVEIERFWRKHYTCWRYLIGNFVLLSLELFRTKTNTVVVI